MTNASSRRRAQRLSVFEVFLHGHVVENAFIDLLQKPVRRGFERGLILADRPPEIELHRLRDKFHSFGAQLAVGLIEVGYPETEVSMPDIAELGVRYLALGRQVLLEVKQDIGGFGRG